MVLAAELGPLEVLKPGAALQIEGEGMPHKEARPKCLAFSFIGLRSLI